MLNLCPVFQGPLLFLEFHFTPIIEFLLLFLNILRQSLAMHSGNPPARASPVLGLEVLATHARLSQDS